MVENVKKHRRARSFVLVGILLGLCIAAAVIWLLFYRNKTYLSDAVPNVDGTIETGSGAADAAMEHFDESIPANVIQAQPEEELRVGLVFVGLTEEADTNEAILNLIKAHKRKVSFALSAAEVLGDEDFLDDMLADGNELLSNNAAGESNLHTKTAREMVDTMSKSREAISTAADETVPLLYCSSTVLTGDVLRAAAVSGYEAVVDIPAGQVLDESSFETAADAEAFVEKLQGDALVAVNLRGLVEAIQNEAAVTAEKPAVDLQPELDDEAEPEEEPADLLTQVGWLLDALDAREVQTAFVRDFAQTEGLICLREEAEAPDAELAPLYHSCLTGERQVGLLVRHFPTVEEMEEVLQGLGETGASATFFLEAENETGAQVTALIRDRHWDISRLREAGSSVGLALSAETLEGMDGGDVFDFLYEAFRSESDLSRLVLVEETAGDEAIHALRAAAHLLNVKVVQTTSRESATEQVQPVESAGSGQEAFVEDMAIAEENTPSDNDSTVQSGSAEQNTVHGDTKMDSSDNENAADKKAGSFIVLDAWDADDVAAIQQDAAENNLQIVDLETLFAKSGTLPALNAAEISALRKENDHQLAEAQNMVYTTERAVSFAFYGLKNTTAAMDAADRLHDRGGSGTFFATLDELMNCSAAVEHVLAQGHELGISYRVSGDYPQTFDAVANYLHSWQQYALWRYGVEASVVFMPADTPAEGTKEAISASGCRLIDRTTSVVKSDDKECTPEDVPAMMEAISKERVMRGSFVCFNMNFYTYDQSAPAGDTLLGAVLDAFLTEHVDALAYHTYDTGEIEDASRFAITTASHLLNSTEQYAFCTEPQTDVTLDKNVLTGMAGDEDRFQYIADHYIGTSFVTSSRKLPGFSDAEIRKMDTKGRFTSDKVLFLTFDDWGTEQSLNELLYVLEKHGVKATFFITTQHVDSNPNLLRTIAAKGHQIACHTDGHLPLSNTVEGTKNLAETLTEEEAQTLRQDLVTAYEKLYKYTGDVVVDGKASLSRMFRPPTLAVSKIGISQVFDVGYTYSISGDMSTDDYKAESYTDMVNQLKVGITDGGDHIQVHDGSVIVMHMLENAKYTAQALDTMIPYWQQKGYTFARLDDYLGE